MSEQSTSVSPRQPIIVPLSKAQRVRLARINAEITRWTQTRDEVGTAIVAGVVDPEELGAAGWKLMFEDTAVVVVPPPQSAAQPVPPTPPQNTQDGEQPQNTQDSPDAPNTQADSSAPSATA